MTDDFLARIELWHRDDEYEKIITAIKALEPDQLTDHLLGRLASSLNNIDLHDSAIGTLNSMSDDAKRTALWHYRMGYAHYYEGRVEDALALFETARDLGDSDANLFITMCKQDLAAASGEDEGDDSGEYTDDQIISDCPYLGVISDDPWIKLVFLTHHDPPFNVGKQIGNLHPAARIDGQDWEVDGENWHAIFKRYLTLYHDDLQTQMATSFGEGVFEFYYPANEDNKVRALSLMALVQSLIETPQSLYDFVRAEGKKIVWAKG